MFVNVDHYHLFGNVVLNSEHGLIVLLVEKSLHQKDHYHQHLHVNGVSHLETIKKPVT